MFFHLPPLICWCSIQVKESQTLCQRLLHIVRSKHTLGFPPIYLSETLVVVIVAVQRQHLCYLLRCAMCVLCICVKFRRYFVKKKYIFFFLFFSESWRTWTIKNHLRTIHVTFHMVFSLLPFVLLGCFFLFNLFHLYDVCVSFSFFYFAPLLFIII